MDNHYSINELSPLRVEIDVKIRVSKSAVVDFNGWLVPDEIELDHEFGGFIVKKHQSVSVSIVGGDSFYEQYARFMIRYGSALEVIEPLELRNTMREFVKHLYDLYKCDGVAFDDLPIREQTSERDPIFDEFILHDEDPTGTKVARRLEKRGDYATVPRGQQGALWAFRKANLFEVCVNGTVIQDTYDSDSLDEAVRYEGELPRFADEFFFLEKYKEFKLEAPPDLVEKLQKEIKKLYSIYSEEHSSL